MKTRAISLRIAGDWVDCWLYKDTLYAWSMDGDLFYVPTDRIVREIRNTSTANIAFAAQFALFRNDWATNSQTKSMKTVPEFRDAFSRVFSSVPSAIDISPSIFRPVDSEPIPGMILSVAIYGNHAFIGSSSGLFELNVNPAYLEKPLDLVDRMDSAVHAVSANFGAVAGAAFENGLWWDTIDLSGSDQWVMGGPLAQIADYSRDVSMASRDLLNYTDEAFPDLFIADATQSRQNDRSKYPSWQIRGYTKSQDRLERLTANSLGMSQERLKSLNARLVANSKQHLLVDTSDGFEVVRLKTARDPSVTRERKPNHDSSKLLRTEGTRFHSFGNGFLAETSGGTVALSAGGAIELTARAPVRVRTFPASRGHFNRVAAVVEEEALVIAGLLDF
jgi:hypothetical protein